MKKIILFFLVVIMLTSCVSATVIYNYGICGKSMKPTINEYTECSVKKVIHVRASRVNVNDIICFNFDKRKYNWNGQYICHRATDKNESHIKTKGDNNLYTDGWTENKFIALKVVT